jgi:BolA protein
MNIAKTIEVKLSCLEPVILEIIDESSKHVGHIGHTGEGETHFKLKIVSDSFIGKSMVSRHKMIYKLLEEELGGKVHALALKTMTKDELAK